MAMTLPGRHSADVPATTRGPGTAAHHHHHHHHQHHHQHHAPPPPPSTRVPLRLLLRAASVACGVQFGWALQLSLLTPYVQELGIPHAWASLVWLCGPISGLFVQPLIGHLSDRSTSSFGRRRPYIIGGAVAIAFAVLLIGYSADIGGALGDPPVGRKPRAIVVFVLGFWLLDVGNNTTQGPCRALLGDLTGNDFRRTRVANAYFSLFMALGNILGFATGSFSGWHSALPFTVTSSCGVNCANLKSAFLLDIILLVLTTYISVSSAKETPSHSRSGASVSVEEDQQQLHHGEEAFLWELFGSVRYLPPQMWIILTVTAFTWIGWFPFLLFDTDWMGREVYKGKPNEGQNYHNGVRMGSFALMLNSVLLGLTSVAIGKICKKFGAGLTWGLSNIFMAICFVAMLIIAFVAKDIDYGPRGLPPNGIVIASLVVFAALGVPLAITYSVPYAMVSTRSEALGIGQGLAMGILNLAIVIPQMVVSVGSGPWDQLFGGGNSPAFAVGAMVVSVGSGPWDQLFGGGNSPAFAVGAVAAFISGIIAIVSLPPSYVAKARGRH